jgi:hypothetical protein
VKQLDLLQTAHQQGKNHDILSTDIIPECLNVPFNEYKKFLEGDEMATFIALRRATWGDTYRFSYTCPDCKQRDERVIDLKSLRVQTLHPEQPVRGLFYDLYLSGDEVPSHVIKWHIPTVSDRLRAEKEMVKYIQESGSTQGFILTFSMSSRIDDIMRVVGGDPENTVSILGALEDYRRRQRIREFVMDQGVNFVTDFMEGSDEFSCGVDTGIQFKCKNYLCGNEWEEELPLKDSFFSSTKESSPSSKQQRRRGQVRTPWKRKSERTTEENPTPETTPKTATPSPPETPSSETTDQAPSTESSTSSSLEPLSRPRST